MRIGKIKSSNTFDENRVFSGMDITAEYLDQKGYKSELSFHYAYYSNNLSGLVMKVLDALFTGKPTPENITNVRTE